MCGIAGIYNFISEPRLNEIEGMVSTIGHRGPDNEHSIICNNIALGHARLSIIDTNSTAHQPMYSSDRRYIIVFNGEIYNYKELSKELNIEFKTSSDTEVLLEAFIRWGVDCYERLNGMFAFSVYDTMTDELYLFRDRMGIKPLFYYSTNEIFSFCSEIKGILACDQIKKMAEPDRKMVVEFLHLGYIAEPNTIYKNLKKFPAGSVGIFKEGKLSIEKRWDINSLISPETHNDYKKTKSELTKLIQSSVEYRMMSDVPYGTFLSGGIDSSLITAVAQSLKSKPIKTFSLGIKDSEKDESKHAKKISKHLGTDHHELMVSVKDIKNKIEPFMNCFDEPFADSSGFLLNIVSGLAKEEVKMVLSGDGGDELFMGYGAYKWATRLNRPIVKSLKKPIKQILRLGNNRMQRASEMFSDIDPSKIASHIFSQEQYYFTELEAKEILVQATNSPINSEEYNFKREVSAKEKQALFDINSYLKDDLLVKVDRASMLHGLEARTPLLDHRIVEYAVNIDEKLKENKGVSKSILKDILHDYAPKDLFNRPKQGFSIPLGSWLKADLYYLIDKF